MAVARGRPAVRIVAPLVALLVCTIPATQALAQVERQEQGPNAAPTGEPGEILKPIAALMTGPRAAGPDPARLLRPGSESFFPIIDPLAAGDPVDPMTSAAAMSTGGTIALVIGVVVIVLVLVFVIACGSVDGCLGEWD